jgi:uncharacterized coiled-coil DUF342 family protein
MITEQDIVERLRNHVNHRNGPSLLNGAWQMMLDAADEITKLRAERDAALALQKCECDPDEACEVLTKAWAERDAALERARRDREYCTEQIGEDIKLVNQVIALSAERDFAKDDARKGYREVNNLRAERDAAAREMRKRCAAKAGQFLVISELPTAKEIAVNNTVCKVVSAISALPDTP